MRFHFKTDYRHDIALFEDRRDMFLYGLLALVAVCAPFFLGDYLLGEFTYVLILTVAGLVYRCKGCPERDICMPTKAAKE